MTTEQKLQLAAMPAPDARPVLTPEEAADILGITREAADRLMDSGRLRSENLGSKTRKFRRTSAAWIAEYQRGRVHTVGKSPSPALLRTPGSPVIGLIYAGLRG